MVFENRLGENNSEIAGTLIHIKPLNDSEKQTLLKSLLQHLELAEKEIEFLAKKAYHLTASDIDKTVKNFLRLELKRMIKMLYYINLFSVSLTKENGLQLMREKLLQKKKSRITSQCIKVAHQLPTA